MNSPAPSQMKTNETARNGVKASPWATPMTKLMVGETNCRKPIADSGMRRAPQANRAKGARR